MADLTRSALEHEAGTGSDLASLRQQPCAGSFEGRGLAPPPAPSKLFLFKSVLSKHMFLAMKRSRPCSTLFTVLLWSILTLVLYNTFESQISDANKIKLILEAIILPLYLALLVSQSMAVAIADIVSEKESKMKVIQDVYGLPAFVYWASWYAYYSIVSIVCLVIICILLYGVSPVFAGMNPVIVIFVWYVAFAQQFIMACVASALFDTVRTATMFASFLNLLLMGLASAMQGFLHGKATWVWWLSSFLPLTNTFNVFSSMFYHKAGYVCTGSTTAECAQPGLTFGNLFQDYVCIAPYQADGDWPPCDADAYWPMFPAGNSLIMMVVNVFLYMLLAWWLENVRQGEYGSAKPLCFCLDPRFMFSGRSSMVPLVRGEGLAMSIRDLTKKFGDKVAVDNLSLDMKGSEIFALLGHNGAGKTTAINCVVGLLPPTSGGAIVNGYDIYTDLEAARRQLSICPQDNPLYNEFTVRRHLMFFACLRGVPEARVEARITEVLAALGMLEKLDALCNSLSGGQKRRLWVATALVGDSPISFLDEPTSGMDPASRRELWSLLLDMKAQGRCVIFTTHYLEEADVLADRKAVMARGKAMAVGTSRELKTQFGLGYHLAVELTPGASDAKISQLRTLVAGHIPTAQDEAQGDEEAMQASDASLFYRVMLPYDTVPKFGGLLQELEEKKAALGASHYVLAMTSLEEVFMALGRQAEQEAGDNSNTDFMEVATESAAAVHREESTQVRSMLAMARVRRKAIFGDKRSFYVTVILPTIFIVLSVMLVQGNNSSAGSTAGGDWSIAFYPPMAFGLGTLSFTLTIVGDRDPTTKIKHTTLAQGISPLAYWLGTAMSHYMCSMPVLVAFIVMIFVKGTEALTGPAFPLLLVMVIVYPAALLVYAYNVALIFNSIETAAKYTSLFSMFAGTIPVGVEFIFLSLNNNDWSQIFHYLFSALNPVYGLPGMIVMLIFKSDEINSLSDALVHDAAVPLYLLPVCICLWGAHLVWRESRSYATVPGEFVHFDGERKDEDVVAEEQRIRGSAADPSSEIVRYEGLSHSYKAAAGNVCAVRGISLGIRTGECFGLLGPNGAGKTTTLSVLTGELRPPTAGQVQIFGHNVATSEGLYEAYQVLGVCPQVDPLWPTLSGREHLLFYGAIKGVSQASLDTTVDNLLRRLGLFGDADKKASEYSGGMKRKLSVGIALIGHSPLLFLDEPSAAVDAGAKRHLWKVIKRRGPDQTVVLTTHSMEEAEALCDRLAIQVKGQLRCLGTPNHIKRKYGSGYQLELFCREVPPAPGTSMARARSGSFTAAAAPAQSVLDFASEQLSPKAQLLEFHAGRYLFQLPPLGEDNLTLGKVFTKLSEHKERVGITDYSVTQPSLEQVFLRFAREQDQGDAPAEAVEEQQQIAETQ